MSEIKWISRGLHDILQEIVGPAHIVKINHEVIKLANDINTNSNIKLIFTGSYGEGIRFKSSDIDTMIEENSVRVVTKMEHAALYQSSSISCLMYMDTRHSRPGFAMLQLLTRPQTDFVYAKASITHNGRVYVGSKQFREEKFQDYRTSTSYIHGPCTSDVLGDKEVDYAFCTRSDVWPPQARGCIQRLHKAGWPSHNTLTTIVQNGCHFIPIGAKMSPVENFEWRISFSLAETTIIHSMNHFQFMCYCLLKIFLKEAINQHEDVSDLLCSYFLKTALFWDIQTNSQFPWSPETFMSGCWRVFTRLISWVRNGYCPNFFIPENNMFAGKIHGRKQEQLLTVLCGFYKDGYRSFLQCESLQPQLLKEIMESPGPMSVPIDIHEYMSSQFYDLIIAKELRDLCNLIPTDDLKRYVRRFIDLQNARKSETNSTRTICLNMLDEQYRCSLGLHLISSALKYCHNFKNKCNFPLLKNAFHMVNKGGSNATERLLSVATYLFLFERYEEAVEVLSLVKQKMQSPHLMYYWHLDWKKYSAAKGSKLGIQRISKKYIADLFSFSNMCAISQLQLESTVSAKIYCTCLQIPPLVYTNMLAFLCHRKLMDTTKYPRNQVKEVYNTECYPGNENLRVFLKAASNPNSHPQEHHGITTKSDHKRKSYLLLDELSMLLHYDNDDYHIPWEFQQISWQILGICHQMVGDYLNAYVSYVNAVHTKSNFVRYDTYVRLINLLMEINQNQSWICLW